jgi:hypothetical protein
MRVRLLLSAALMVLTLCIPATGMAERFADLYLGAAISQDVTVNYRMRRVRPPANSISTCRIHHRLPHGLLVRARALDRDRPGSVLFQARTQRPICRSSHFSASDAAVPLLRSDRYPTGEWQPYVAVGPGLFYSKFNRGRQRPGRVQCGTGCARGDQKNVPEQFRRFPGIPLHPVPPRLLSFDPQ